MSLAVARSEGVHAAAFSPTPQINACKSCAGRSGLCAAVETADLGRLATLRRVQTVAPGTTFIDEAALALHIVTITSGTARLFKLLADGRRQIIGFLVAGDIFGFTPDDVYTASAEAVDVVTLCRFPRSQLERMFTEFPGMERQLLRLVTHELTTAQDQMVLLGRKTAHERVASFLRTHARRQRHDDWVDLPMTRTDIADYLGLTMETVSRVFGVLKASGCIASAGLGKVRILDAEALADLADGGADEGV